MEITIRTCLLTVGNMDVNTCQNIFVKSFANIKKELLLPQLRLNLNKN
jgi:hypothetical protein